MPVFANAIDPNGEEINAKMSPTKVKRILTKLTKTTTTQQKYSLNAFAAVVDQVGEEINVTMYTNTWDKVEAGQTYICHHLQIDIYKNKGVNQLRTLPITTFMEAPDHLQI